MDPHAFDRLARRFRHAASRRRAVGGLLAGALAARLPALDGTSGALAQGKRGARDGQGQQKVPVCHDGHTLLLPLPAAQAHLAHGDTLAPCRAPGGGTCVPNDQVCSLLSPIRCCGDPRVTACLDTAAVFVTTCQTPCGGDRPADYCQQTLGYPDVQCVQDRAACAPTAHTCCRPNVCPSQRDCKGGGPCCLTLAGVSRCCAPGQVCSTFGGCATA